MAATYERNASAESSARVYRCTPRRNVYTCWAVCAFLAFGGLVEIGVRGADSVRSGKVPLPGLEPGLSIPRSAKLMGHGGNLGDWTGSDDSLSARLRRPPCVGRAVGGCLPMVCRSSSADLQILGGMQICRSADAGFACPICAYRQE